VSCFSLVFLASSFSYVLEAELESLLDPETVLFSNVDAVPVLFFFIQSGFSLLISLLVF
jgi:hypothetical protein